MADTIYSDVGLLVAHGVGQQARFETIRKLAGALAGEIGANTCSVIDRTYDRAELPPSCPAIDLDTAPIVLVCKLQHGSGVRIHLHEAWWADLGGGGGAFDQLRFWNWGLGQAGETVKRGTERHRSNTDNLMQMPGLASAAAKPGTELSPSSTEDQAQTPGLGTRFDADKGASGRLGVLPRLALALSAVLAVWTVMCWEALRAVLARFVPALVGSALLVEYLGDIRTYTDNADKDRLNLLDPGLPTRATIRRRMVREMVAMAERGYDRWYIMGHSLGSVLAYNAVQEPEVSLANYLDCDHWQRLAAAGALCTSQAYIPDGAIVNYDTMMPRRPTWLAQGEGISRIELFRNFRGLITYGSPLDKFAALWPRLVAINKQREVFAQGTDWLNLSDATDPVGAELHYFSGGWASQDPGNVGPLNQRVASSKAFLWAHIGYFARKGRPDTAALARTLRDGGGLAERFEAVSQGYGGKWQRWALAGGGGLAIASTLYAGATAATWLASKALAKFGLLTPLTLWASAEIAALGPLVIVTAAVAGRWITSKWHLKALLKALLRGG